MGFADDEANKRAAAPAPYAFTPDPYAPELPRTKIHPYVHGRVVPSAKGSEQPAELTSLSLGHRCAAPRPSAPRRGRTPNPYFPGHRALQNHIELCPNVSSKSVDIGLRVRGHAAQIASALNDD